MLLFLGQAVYDGITTSVYTINLKYICFSSSLFLPPFPSSWKQLEVQYFTCFPKNSGYRIHNKANRKISPAPLIIAMVSVLTDITVSSNH